jgi:hypothetical protein
MVAGRRGGTVPNPGSQSDGLDDVPDTGIEEAETPLTDAAARADDAPLGGAGRVFGAGVSDAMGHTPNDGDEARIEQP